MAPICINTQEEDILEILFSRVRKANKIPIYDATKFSPPN